MYIKTKMCDLSETVTWKNTKDLRFIILDGKPIETVNGYTYPGLYFSNSGSVKMAIENLTSKASRHLGALERA